MKTVMALLLTAAAASAGDLREDAARKLEAKISVDLRGAKLADALETFRSATGLNFVAMEGGETIVSLTVRDVSVRSALRLLLQPSGLGAAFEDGAVVIRNRRGLVGAATLRVYDVRAATAKLRDFPGPRMDLGPVHVSGLF